MTQTHSFETLRRAIDIHPRVCVDWRKVAFPTPEIVRLWQVQPPCFIISASSFGGGHLSAQHFQTAQIGFPIRDSYAKVQALSLFDSVRVDQIEGYIHFTRYSFLATTSGSSPPPYLVEVARVLENEEDTFALIILFHCEIEGRKSPRIRFL